MVYINSHGRSNAKVVFVNIVGTLRKNKPEIPNELKTCSHVGATNFLYGENKTLLSYCPKKNKIVFLLSSLHKTGKYDTYTGKPEMISFYNSTKGGTDTFDQMCHEYSEHELRVAGLLGFFMACLIKQELMHMFYLV